MENKTNENENEENHSTTTLIDSELKSVKNESQIVPLIGRIYSVQRIDSQWIPAEVLEKREIKNKPVEYFVHFENSNSLKK